MRLISKRILFYLFCLFFILNPYAAYALGPDIGKMIQNLAETVPHFMALVTATSTLIGIALMAKTIYDLKKYGEGRTMMTSDTDLRGPFMSFVAASMLLYLPNAMDSSIQTFWQYSTPMAYTVQNDQWSDLIGACIKIIQIIGLISFIRGWMLLSHIGNRAAQQGSGGKGLAHVISGILAFNIVGFIDAIMITLGLSSK